ncbi:GNAT family N-acetyltransferase [Pseudoneobacillus sp. C159]
MFPKLETERLVLREIVSTDAQTIFDCFSNEDVTRYYGMEPMTELEQANQLIQLFSKNHTEKRGIRWGIELKVSGELIGTIGFNNWAPKHKRAEIGYDLHPLFWRKGYASEAISLISTYGFRKLGLTRIGAVVYLENESSNQVLLKLGFQHEGILRSYMYQNGIAYDTNVYSLLKP